MHELGIVEKQFLERLKSETSEAHQQLEETALSENIMSPTLSKEQYAVYLQKMLPLHKALEESIYPRIDPIFPDLQERRKVSSIQNDLSHLPETRVVQEFDQDISFTDDPAGALGFMYVLEGSSLGGRVILKHLNKVFPENEVSDMTHYFSGYGEKTGPMWMRFLSDFAGHVTANNLENEVIDSARQSFKVIHNWFQI